MLRIILLAVFTTFSPLVKAQSIFAHNDYEKQAPFHHAFSLKADCIEADIFLENNVLLVAHTIDQLDPARTLESLYLKPIVEKEKDLYGLQLMIDLKTEGTSTLSALVKELEKYPTLINSRKLFFVISGSYPPPSEWKNYPKYIWFDGRPGVSYTPDEKERLKLVSTDFASVSEWDGNGEIPKNDLVQIKKIIDAAHAIGQPMRFWASPDFDNAWDRLIDAGVDIINSDHIDELSQHLKKKK